MNVFLMYGAGLLSLTPVEQLRVWRRSNEGDVASYLDEGSPSWPWALAVSVAALFMMAALGPSQQIGRILEPLGVCTIFVVRDLLFLQYCVLTRMKHGLVAGAAYLGLYYTTVAIFVGVFDLKGLAEGFSFFSVIVRTTSLPSIAWVGVMAQAGIILMLVAAVERLLKPVLAR